jgi:hypothetical protein
MDRRLWHRGDLNIFAKFFEDGVRRRVHAANQQRVKMLAVCLWREFSSSGMLLGAADANESPSSFDARAPIPQEAKTHSDNARAAIMNALKTVRGETAYTVAAAHISTSCSGI